jgi:antitoxin HicB
VAQDPVGRRSTDPWQGYRHCRVRMASRHADMPPSRRWAMGSTKQPDRKLNRPGSVLPGSRPARAPARLREKVADRPAGGAGARPSPSAGGGKLKTSSHAHTGSSFESFLKEHDLYEEVTAEAVKVVIAWQIRSAMKAQGISKTRMAARIRTSRAQLERLLDPTNDKVQLDTLKRAAAALGRKIRLELI